VGGVAGRALNSDSGSPPPVAVFGPSRGPGHCELGRGPRSESGEVHGPRVLRSACSAFLGKSGFLPRGLKQHVRPGQR
jgi:hypothetical protein